MGLWVCGFVVYFTVSVGGEVEVMVDEEGDGEGEGEGEEVGEE